MSSLESVVEELVPQVYELRAAVLGAPHYTDMSRSNQCQTMTFDMMLALQNRGLPVRREYHVDSQGFWHYLLSHENPSVDPTDNDIVTDLNPWQWIKGRGLTGPLHGPRNEVMELLEIAEAPASFIALRGIQTIRTLHAAQR